MPFSDPARQQEGPRTLRLIDSGRPCVAQELGWRYVETPSDADEGRDTRIGVAALHAGHHDAMDMGSVCEGLLAELALLAKPLDGAANLLQLLFVLTGLLEWLLQGSAMLGRLDVSV